MHHQIKGYIELFNPLFKRGLPFFWEEKGGMWSQKEYNGSLISYGLDHKHFDDLQHQSLSVKTMIDKLNVDFKMLFDFKAICTKFPEFSYAENMELNVMAKEMISLDLPTTDKWNLVDNYGKSKYRLHQ